MARLPRLNRAVPADRELAPITITTLSEHEMAAMKEWRSGWLRNCTLEQIKERYGLTPYEAYRLREAAVAEVLADLRRDMDELRAEEFARLEEMAREAWESFDASKEPGVNEVVETIYDEGNVAVRTKVTRTPRSASGDSRWMDKLIQLSSERRKLLGLDAPKRTESIHINDPFSALSSASLNEAYERANRADLRLIEAVAQPTDSDLVGEDEEDDGGES